MVAYYNEIDPYAAQWLRNLIAAEHIASGDVDDRSIKDVQVEDLKGYTQCHFFAGIGGWSYALRLAGWPDDKPVWTGSCPCQPFSVAGKQKGVNDERHLWPDWFNLIQKCKPAVIFGEQVAQAKLWLDGVFFDLENENYSCGAAILPACSVDAPHRRDRIWFMANASGEGRQQIPCGPYGYESTNERRSTEQHNIIASFDESFMADTNGCHSVWWSGPLQVGWNTIEGKATASSIGKGTQWRIKPGISLLVNGVPNRVERLCAYGNAIVPQVAAEFIKACL
jgi:DNA (cytosine-5)-methyltransferase 1